MRALAILLALSLLGCSPQRVRVVLVTLDTLRYDSLSPGRERQTTLPRLAALAARSARFERFYATTSTTQPTHATLFTGLQPWQHGVTRNGIRLDERLETLAEILQDAGFTTAAVVAAYSMHRTFGWHQGFDEFRDEFDITLEVGRLYSLATAVTDRALEVLDGSTAHRQFLWLHYYDPHDPYGDSLDSKAGLSTEMLRDLAEERDPTAAALVRAARDLYDRDVEFLDEQLARVLDRVLEEADRYETHLIITSDHGESFGEGGAIGHGTRLSPEQIQVPLVIRSPRIAPGRRRDVAGSIDIFPTLLACAGVEHTPRGGRDLAAAPTNGVGSALGMRRTYTHPQREPTLAGPGAQLADNRYYAVIDGRLFAGDARGVRENDREGSEAAPEIADLLRPRFAEFEAGVRGASGPEAVDAETLERLRALGYAP